MTATRKFTFPFILLLGLLTASTIAFTQNTNLDPGKWADELAKKGVSAHDSAGVLSARLTRMDSLQAFRFIDELAEKGKSKNHHFKARFNRLKAATIYNKRYYYPYFMDKKPVDTQGVKQQIMELYSDAIDHAYRSEDDYVIAYISYSYASVIVMFGEVGLSVMYAKNATDLFDKISNKIDPGHYQFLAELLYRVREYDQSIFYGKKAILARQVTGEKLTNYTVSCINTVALGYHRQNKYDSAFIFYNQALQQARQLNDTVWMGIISGNIGQIYYAQGKYDTAYSLLKMDYESSKAKKYYDNAANSLQWAARVNLALGNEAAALAELREAKQLLKLWPDANYLRNIYFTATQIFREMGAYDSAFYYNSLYSAVNDSLEKVVATSSLSLSRAKLNDETSKYNIQNLNREKKQQILLRNIIIAGIVLFSIFALLMVNRRRLQARLKMEKAEQEKFLIQQEMDSARAQLNMFTENIIEKSNLIERLESQVQDKNTSSEQHRIISELSQQTILTEDEWLSFKLLFEKIYPGFFKTLKEKFPDITLAEQRMAALIRLNLTTRQIASMLGISVDSVHKSRQRLRHRFQVGADSNLEEMVANL